MDEPLKDSTVTSLFLFSNVAFLVIVALAIIVVGA